MQTLVSAAVGLWQPARLPSNAGALAKSLDACLDEPARARLRSMVAAASERGIPLDVSALLRDTELVAGRIGMVACTDLTVAARQGTIESRAAEGLTPQSRARDLLAFAVSETHAKVRSALGMTVGSSAKSLPPTAF